MSSEHETSTVEGLGDAAVISDGDGEKGTSPDTADCRNCGEKGPGWPRGEKKKGEFLPSAVLALALTWRISSLAAAVVAASEVTDLA